MTTAEVTVWICSNCGNYFAASSAGDMRRMVTDQYENPMFPRNQCPDCRINGIEAYRQPYTLTVPIQDPVKIDARATAEMDTE